MSKGSSEMDTSRESVEWVAATMTVAGQGRYAALMLALLEERDHYRAEANYRAKHGGRLPPKEPGQP